VGSLLFSNAYPLLAKLGSAYKIVCINPPGDSALGIDETILIECSSRYGLHSSSGSLAIFAAIRRASSLLSDLAADRRPGLTWCISHQVLKVWT
jgi:hypothetical protein